jgi:hypothetical protein
MIMHVKVLRVPESLHIESRTVRCVLCALFLTVVADGLLSQFLVTGGYGWEGNPLLMSWVGGDGFLALKVAGAFLATLLLWIKYNAKPKLVYTVAVVALCSYTIIVHWNVFVFCFTAFN